MPVALSTTKRKFHQILDSISNASNTSIVPQSHTKNASTTTLSGAFESPAKKARTARPISTLVTSISDISGSRNRPTTTNRPPSPSRMPAVVHGAEPPNFAPWDRGQFLKRLETFRHVDKWRGKPEKVNEVQWAKRGWSCVGRDTIKCVGGCSQEMVVKLEGNPKHPTQEIASTGTNASIEEPEDAEDWREKARQQLTDAYAEKTITGHAAGCLWRRRGCDDTIFRLPLYHQTNAISAFGERYESLLPMAADLPTNLLMPDAFDLPKSLSDIRSLLQRPNAPPNPRPTTPNDPPSPSHAVPSCDALVNREALILALFGWQAETGHIAGLATCTSCFRRLGLWLFRPRVSATGEEKEAAMSHLDVIDEHRDYCPWVNAVSQNGLPSSRPSTSSSQTDLGDKAGWELLSRIVLNAVQSRRRELEQPPAREPPATPRSQADDISVTSTFATATTAVERATRDEKDKERWVRLKRLKQAFHIRKGKKKGNTAAT